MLRIFALTAAFMLMGTWRVADAAPPSSQTKSCESKSGRPKRICTISVIVESSPDGATCTANVDYDEGYTGIKDYQDEALSPTDPKRVKKIVVIWNWISADEDPDAYEYRFKSGTDGIRFTNPQTQLINIKRGKNVSKWRAVKTGNNQKIEYFPMIEGKKPGAPGIGGSYKECSSADPIIANN